MKLYNQCLNKLKNEQKNLPWLKEALIKLKGETPKSSSVQELEQKIAQWSEPLRIEEFQMSAQVFLNQYYVEYGNFTQASVLLKEKIRTEVDEVRIRCHAELIRRKKSLYEFDNVLSRRFLLNYCPERKLKSRKKESFDQPDTELICPLCNVSVQSTDEEYICKCGYSTTVFAVNPQQSCSYEVLAQMTSNRKFTYKKLNHFRETLRQAQGLSNARIPNRCLELIENELKITRQKSELLDPALMKKILKKIDYSDFFEEKVNLTCRFNDKYKPITLTSDEEEKLCLLFSMLETAYPKIKTLINKRRKNFMSYPSTARRLCIMLNWTHLVPAFPLLKDERLQIIQDEYFELCCRINGWEFIPTVGDIRRGGHREQMILVESEESQPPIKKPCIRPMAVIDFPENEDYCLAEEDAEE